MFWPTLPAARPPACRNGRCQAASGRWPTYCRTAPNLGKAYTIANYPTMLNPATAGLRNITGVVNADGTVTIYGVTSTVSGNGDQGADPNKLVSITDNLANTAASGASAETFTTLRTAVAGEILRGISFTPSSTTMADVPLILSAASPSVSAIAPGGVAFAMGQNLAPEAGAVVGTTLPTTFGGTTVSIKDAAGTTTNAPLIYVSSGKVTFQVPSGVAAGKAQVTVTSTGSTQTASNVVIAPVAPALFTANGNSLLIGWGIRVASGGAATIVPALTVNSQGSFSAAPISMGAATDKVYLAFYATGVQAAGLANVTVISERSQRAGVVCRQRRVSRHRSGECAVACVAGGRGNGGVATDGFGFCGEPGATRDSVESLPVWGVVAGPSVRGTGF